MTRKKEQSARGQWLDLAVGGRTREEARFLRRGAGQMAGSAGNRGTEPGVAARV